MANFTQAGSHASGHRDALETVPTKQTVIKKHLDLMFKCDQYWYRRDDWGNDNRVEGVNIGVYHHDSDDLRNANQYVWILHLELTSVERPLQSPNQNRPTGFRMYRQHM